MLAAKFYIKVKRGNALMLRITNNRKKVEMSMGFRMTEEALNNIQSPKPKPENLRYVPLFTFWETKIAELKICLAKAGRGDKDVRVLKAMMAKAFLDGREEPVEEERPSHGPEAPKGTFVPFFKAHAEAYMKRSTRESNEYTLSCMRKFQPGTIDRLTFEDINYAWLSDFEAYMKKAGLSQNTCRIHFANIRAAINDAYKRELTDVDPFRRFKLKKEKTIKRSLPVEELRKLFCYDAEPHAVYYRDMFKLIFMLIVQ